MKRGAGGAKEQRQEAQAFVDALRVFLGLSPLYSDPRRRDDERTQEWDALRSPDGCRHLQARPHQP